MRQRPVASVRGPRRPSATASATRRRRTAAGPDTRQVVTQITQLVAANERLKLENATLQPLNEQLRGELTAIGYALGSLTGGRRGRGRGRPPSRRPKPSRGARGSRSPIPRCWPAAVPRSPRRERRGRRSWRRQVRRASRVESYFHTARSLANEIDCGTSISPGKVIASRNALAYRRGSTNSSSIC